MPVADWPDGYTLSLPRLEIRSRRGVWQDVLAPYNLPVPPYIFTDVKTVRIGENPPKSTHSLNDIVQI